MIICLKAIIRLLKRIFNNKGTSVTKMLEFSFEELKNHLEKNFSEGMNWDNYGTYWHIDHIIPLSWFEKTENAAKRAWKLENLYPLKSVDNLSKGNRTILFSGMPLNYYQAVSQFAVYPKDDKIKTLMYLCLGLGGEVGEVQEKVKKIFRDNNGEVTKDIKEAIKLELSDVLWYLSMLAYELGYTLEEIAQSNIDKLSSRQTRGVLKGSGDNR